MTSPEFRLCFHIPIHLTSLKTGIGCTALSHLLLVLYTPASNLNVLFRCQEIHYPLLPVIVPDVWPITLHLPVEVLFTVVVSVNNEVFIPRAKEDIYRF